MQISGQDSSEMPHHKQSQLQQKKELVKEEQLELLPSLRKSMESLQLPLGSNLEIEECTPLSLQPQNEPLKQRERRQSVELIYSDIDAAEPPSNLAPLSPKKGTCVVQTRCTDYVKLCLCEVKRHKSLTSCWLVSNSIVYDVTNVIQQHPAGTKCILRKAGGQDCTQDLKFHSKDAQRCWKQCAIGKLLPCGDSDPATDDGPGVCAIM
ncbi:hypothetical protein AC1031_016990 [Aphanomyces cochlioides]|nr:hypothetical protein AC1031_016990 [Aphanomyces cochlioides]